MIANKKLFNISFKKEIPLIITRKEISDNTKIVLKNYVRRIGYFFMQNSKNRPTWWDFYFHECNPLTASNIKTITKLFYTSSPI